MEINSGMADQEPVADAAAVQEALNAVQPVDPPAAQVPAQGHQGGAEQVGDRPQVTILKQLFYFYA